MRARNREINIFNMSLLDILTGMLGAFLFLMLGLLPYYAKVSKNKDMNPEEMKQLREENKNLQDQVQLQQQQIADLQKQLDELQKIVKQSGGGPLTADQIQQLMDQMTQLRKQVEQLQNEKSQMQGQLAQAQQEAQEAKQQLDETTKDRDFWKAQQGTVAILSAWDSADTDIDVLVMTPDGKIFSPKVKDNVLGKDCVYNGDDSHVNGGAFSHEGLEIYLEKSGDYLVFYRVPANAHPADYASLHAYVLYTEILGKGKGGYVIENTLGDSKASMAKPGGYYAWAVISYDSTKYTFHVKPATGNLPKGIVLPQDAPVQPPPRPQPRPSIPGFPPTIHRSASPGVPPPAPHF